MKTLGDLAREAGFIVNGARLECPECEINLLGELTSFAALVRDQALDEAAAVCKTQHRPFDMDLNDACDLCAQAILALKSRTQG